MRIYINGEFIKNGLKDGETFLPTSLLFENEEENSQLEIEGHLCESCVEDTKFFCRWKGVDFSEGISHIDEFIKLLRKDNLKLTNMEANYDGSPTIKVTSIVMQDDLVEVKLNHNLLSEEIEFIEF